MLICPRCSEGNVDRARFCSNCGEPLGEPEQRRRERKYATALFADLVDSTSLAETEDPEIVQSLVGRAFDRLTAEISRYEGLPEKFMGDAVLAVFGVPRSHEDDAERAVRAALEMQADPLGEQRPTPFTAGRIVARATSSSNRRHRKESSPEPVFDSGRRASHVRRAATCNK